MQGLGQGYVRGLQFRSGVASLTIDGPGQKVWLGLVKSGQNTEPKSIKIVKACKPSTYFEVPSLKITPHAPSNKDLGFFRVRA